VSGRKVGVEDDEVFKGKEGDHEEEGEGVSASGDDVDEDIEVDMAEDSVDDNDDDRKSLGSYSKVSHDADGGDDGNDDGGGGELLSLSMSCLSIAGLNVLFKSVDVIDDSSLTASSSPTLLRKLPAALPIIP